MSFKLNGYLSIVFFFYTKSMHLARSCHTFKNENLKNQQKITKNQVFKN